MSRPWRRWETWTAIVALFVVSGALLPLSVIARAVFAGIAFSLILTLFVARFATKP